MDERRITRNEKNKLLQIKDPDHFTFDLDDDDEESKGRKSRVTFADPMDDSQPFEIVKKQAMFIIRDPGQVRGSDFKIQDCV